VARKDKKLAQDHIKTQILTIVIVGERITETSFPWSAFQISSICGTSSRMVKCAQAFGTALM